MTEPIDCICGAEPKVKTVEGTRCLVPPKYVHCPSCKRNGYTRRTYIGAVEDWNQMITKEKGCVNERRDRNI